jgi:hypothetical protein
MPAVKITKVIPMDRQRLTEIWRNTFHKFPVVRNLSDTTLNTTINRNSAIRDWDFLSSEDEIIG